VYTLVASGILYKYVHGCMWIYLLHLKTVLKDVLTSIIVLTLTTSSYEKISLQDYWSIWTKKMMKTSNFQSYLVCWSG